MPTSFTTRKLQRYLENHYGDYVVIQSQGQGKSNMIIRINKTLGDAIKAASNLKAELKWSNEKQTRRMYSEQTDDQLLYSVASIIRRDIDKVRILKEHYPTSTEVSFENSLQSMPVSLVKLLSLITEERAFCTCTVPSNIKTESDYAFQTFDQQLYAIAQQVKWSKPDICSRHILRLGGFHSLSCFLASIGKLWADGGLRDLLVDSVVYAGNTAELMLNGKEFNRAVRGFTLVFEALQVLFYPSICTLV
ncbi:unnamed protein product [Mytilus edulis]|uniref:Uncharacterized protein n=1 Tax=Mytilus edulis TaxID=6550 RepID=A0A8S3VI66_MYTED|nr:unnamed protein product [Mytilus edulis]